VKPYIIPYPGDMSIFSRGFRSKALALLALSQAARVSILELPNVYWVPGLKNVEFAENGYISEIGEYGNYGKPPYLNCLLFALQRRSPIVIMGEDTAWLYPTCDQSYVRQIYERTWIVVPTPRMVLQLRTDDPTFNVISHIYDMIIRSRQSVDIYATMALRAMDLLNHANTTISNVEQLLQYVQKCGPELGGEDVLLTYLLRQCR